MRGQMFRVRCASVIVGKRAPIVLSVFATLCALLVVGSSAGATAQQSTGCSPQLRRLVNSLSEIDSRLSIGMNYAAYRAVVTRARVAYGLVPWKRTSGLCLSGVGVPAERALNAYARALGGWSQCIQRLTCDNQVSISFRQRQWALATPNVDRALNNLG